MNSQVARDRNAVLRGSSVVIGTMLASLSCGAQGKPPPSSPDVHADDGGGPTPGQATTPIHSQLACGQNHTCLLRPDGLWCWGNNSFEQLGIPGAGAKFPEGRLIFVPTPVRNGITFKSIAATANTTCGLASDRSLYCWGEVGRPRDVDVPGIDGTRQQRDLAAPLLIASDVNAFDLSLGKLCFVSGGTGLTCKGRQPYLQVPTVRDVAQIALAFDGGCVRTQQGEVECWKNSIQATGGMRPGVGYKPTANMSAEIVAGYDHYCSRLLDHTVECWGPNSFGVSLGDGVEGPAEHAVEVPGISDAVALRAGGHTTCAIGQDGRVACWGLLLPGVRPGEPDQQEKSKRPYWPAPTVLPGVPPVQEMCPISSHYCVLGNDGRAACAGFALHGQLGVGLQSNGTPSRLHTAAYPVPTLGP